MIACIDALKGLPEAIEAIYPNIQVVHMIRSCMRFVSWKDYKRVAAQLRTIYQVATEQQALEALNSLIQIRRTSIRSLPSIGAVIGIISLRCLTILRISDE